MLRAASSATRSASTQQRTDRDATAARRIDVTELAVGTEAAARTVDGFELALDCRTRVPRERVVGSRDDRRRAESAERDASRAARDDDGRRLRLCGRGGAVRPASPRSARRRAAAASRARASSWCAPWVAFTVWCPGSARAARPAKAATRAPAAARVIDVVRRRRRAALSRLVGFSRMLPVEQRHMNLR